MAVRLDPIAPDLTTVFPDGTDDINGESSYEMPTTGECMTFVVGEVGHWWVESNFCRPELE